MESLQERIRAALNKSANAISKKAGECETCANAEQNPTPEKVDLMKDSVKGEAGDLISTKTAPEGMPGSTTDVASKTGLTAGPGLTSEPAPTEDGEAEKVLNIKEDSVSKDIELLNKAASVIHDAAAQICNLSESAIADAFRKEASAVAPEDMLMKCASAGNPAAQFMVDYLASFNLGMAKKAAAMDEAVAAAGATTPEDVAAIESALNEAAVANPDLVLAEEEVTPAGAEAEVAEVDEPKEDEDKEDKEDKKDDKEEVKDAEAASVTEDEVQQALTEYGAEVENAVQEAVLQTAIAIQEADPSISDEEAIVAAQEQVADAIETIDAQQALGMVGEDGEYAVSDEDAAAAVDNMLKSASAFPLRDKLVGDLNARLGISPAAFAQRLTR